MTDDYIAWATTWCPAPVSVRAPLLVAAKVYDEVESRFGENAVGDDFFTRALWLEMGIRLGQLGWGISELEAERWPLPGSSRIAEILHDS